MELTASYGQLEAIKYLLTNDICRKEFEKDNSLIAVAFNGFPEVVKYLIKQDKDIECVQDYHDGYGPVNGFTALRTQHRKIKLKRLSCCAKSMQMLILREKTHHCTVQ